MSLEPHKHQAISLEAIRQCFRRGIRSVLWYLPTGGGKSFVAAFMLLAAHKAGHICWFIVHRRELIRQTERAFKLIGLQYGVIAAGRAYESDKRVQICSMGTLIRRIDRLDKPHLIVQDEAHHLPAKTWTEVIKKIGRCYMVGLSASPCRADGRGLGAHFGAMVKGLSIRELINQGYLSKVRTFVPANIDTSGLHIRGGDYITSEAELLMDKPAITGSAVSEYRKLCDHKRAIVFCCSIKHSKHVAEQFRAAGYAAIHLDGKTDDEIRDLAIDDFEKGRIEILCNVDLLGEGLSINAIECVILLRPTESLGLYIQQVGRGLRTWPGKEHLIILDHVNLTQKFGFIDEPREWELTADIIKRKKSDSPGIRVCPQCFAASPARATTCVECGHVFEVKPRQDIEERDGELIELTPDQIARKRARREQGRARSLEQLLEFAKMKGYHENWAYRLHAAREAKREKENA